MTELPQLDCAKIEVAVEDGVVVLSGTVRERRLERLAEDIAYEALGVDEVVNEIRVSRSSSPALTD